MHGAPVSDKASLALRLCAPAAVLALLAPPAPAQARLQDLPAEIRTLVEGVRKSCAELEPSLAPTTEMQGVLLIRLGDRRAIIVDNETLCNERRAGAGCSNRGCDLTIWVRDKPGAWRQSFHEHLYERRLRIDRASGRFGSMSVAVYAGHPWCNPLPGKDYPTGQSCRLTIRYINGAWTPERAR